MALEHVNRRGDVYYVLQGKTKTGKPKYYASKKNIGIPVESLPPEFEVFEHADSAMVSIRKRKPSRILPQQRDLLCDRIRELTDLEFFRVDIDGDSLIVYVPDRNPNDVASLLGGIFGQFGASMSGLQDWTARHCRYSAELKFTLTDASRQRFSASRYCYRGSIDRWITLDTGKKLEVLAEMYLPHLGKESFFDLM
jgi:hypothetical protein